MDSAPVGSPRKRTLISGVDLESSYRSHGEHRVLNTFAETAFWLQVAWYAYRRVPHGLLNARGWWLVILFVNAAALPVYASTRADVVYLLVGALLIELCLRGRAVMVITIVAEIAFVVVGTAAPSSLRNPEQPGVNIDVSGPVIVDTFVLTRTFADITTSGHIINSVPERLPYDNGRSIAACGAAPIPRSIWPNKPLISLGPILGNVIYGNKRSGVPPGMIAESYWNFGCVACHEHGTALSGFLPVSWDHLVCQSRDHPARLAGGSSVRPLDRRVMSVDAEVVEGGIQGGQRG